MNVRLTVTTLALLAVPALAGAQQSAPVAAAFRDYASSAGKNLIAAAEAMPADKYTFKPTPAQMSFADIMVHLAQGNDYLCGVISGAKAPKRAPVAASASKDALLARLKETFAFCDQSLASLDDANLSHTTNKFGNDRSLAEIEIITVGDWADHYSQFANYMRINGLVPPTAKKKM
jgi:uncharacterized damage-inducible protein DinB